MDRESISVEFGSMIFDEAASIDRDIDISLTYRDDENRENQLLLVEVKGKKRPLTVEHVEQLCVKFADIGQVATTSIVSASGFTEAAIKKAKHHGVALSNFEDWDPQKDPLDKMKISPDFAVTTRQYSWKYPPHIDLNFSKEDCAAVSNHLSGDSPIVDAGGIMCTGQNNVSSLIEQIANCGLDMARDGTIKLFN